MAAVSLTTPANGGGGTSSSAASNVDVVSHCGLRPLIAVLSSSGADAVCAKNNVASFADLLCPFASVAFVIKDPNGQQLASKVHFDFRDIAKDGTLLSNTVLPFVLQEAISRIPKQAESDVWDGIFRDTLCHWLEPSDNDFFKTYLGCLFVTSTADDDPVSELQKLVHRQGTQQHGSSDGTASAAAATIGPAHCSPPRWFLPDVLKYHVLLHDEATADDQKANEIFGQVTAAFGAESCYLLKINSTQNSEMPDPWHQYLDVKYKGLVAGLELARQKLMESRQSEAALSPIDTSMSVSATSTLPSLSPFSLSLSGVFATTSALIGGIPSSPVVQKSFQDSISTSLAAISIGSIHGQCLSVEDRERLREFVEKFVKRSLVPFVERTILTHDQVLQNRRGFQKSFTSVRKWLSVASSAASPAPSGPVKYGAESTELQTRRLADLAFLFGLYGYALFLYHTIRKDFSNDQAWFYYAGALEMTAVGQLMAEGQLSSKQSELGYLENSLNHYVTCLQPMLALRCAVFGVEVLTRVGHFLEAANHLIRLTASNLSPLIRGVVYQKAAILYAKAKMHRREAFHYVLAGNWFGQAGLPSLALYCYDQAAPEYLDKAWVFAEDHILHMLAVNSLDPRYRRDCAIRLLRHASPQTIERQHAFLVKYVESMTGEGVEENPLLHVPIADNESLITVFGERPEQVFADEANDREGEVVWQDLEASAYAAGSGGRMIKYPCPMYAGAETPNRARKPTPPFERFRIIVRLMNPLTIPLVVRRLRLGLENVEMLPGHNPSEAFSDIGEIPQLVIPPATLEAGSGSNDDGLLIELFVTPTNKVISFEATKLFYQLVAGSTNEIVVNGHVQLSTRGKRLLNSKEQWRRKHFAPDNRLRPIVSSETWPLLGVYFSGNADRNQVIHAYCNQMFQVSVSVVNQGHLAITALTVASRDIELVSVSEPTFVGGFTGWKLCSARVKPMDDVLVHSVDASNLDALAQPEGKLMLKLAIKAPEDVVDEKVYRVLFGYFAANGQWRQQRYSLRLSTQQLLRCVPKVIKSRYELCGIEIHNVIPSRDAVLAKVELLRLSVAATGERKQDIPPSIGLQFVVPRPVIVECGQSDLVSFFLRTPASVEAPPTLWFSGQPLTDLPAFNDAVAHEFEKRQVEAAKLAAEEAKRQAAKALVDSENPEEVISPPTTPLSPKSLSLHEATSMDYTHVHVRLSLLWKAQVANSDGTIATLLGENWVVNPFAVDKLNALKDAPLEGERLVYGTGIPVLNGRVALVVTERDQRALAAVQPKSYNTSQKTAIKYKVPAVDDFEDVENTWQHSIRVYAKPAHHRIFHDFDSPLPCTCSVTVQVENFDPLRRSARVFIHTCEYISQLMSDDTSSSRRPDTVGLAGRTSSMSQKTQHFIDGDDSSRRKIVTEAKQPAIHANFKKVVIDVAFGATKSFDIELRFSEPFNYNVSEVIGVGCQFADDDSKTWYLEVPKEFVLIQSTDPKHRSSTVATTPSSRECSPATAIALTSLA